MLINRYYHLLPFGLVCIGCVLTGFSLTYQASLWVYVCNSDKYSPQVFVVDSVYKKQVVSSKAKRTVIYLDGKIDGKTISREASEIAFPRGKQIEMLNDPKLKHQIRVLYAPSLEGKYLFNGDLSILSNSFWKTNWIDVVLPHCSGMQPC